MVEKKSDIQELKHKARRYSIKEGIFATAKGAFGDSFISPLAIQINSSNSLIFLLSSISGLLGPLSQMFSSRLIEKYSRKKIVMKSVFLETLMWLPLIAVAVLFYFGIVKNFLPLALFLTFSFYVIFANISGPAWFSWMGDLVDEEYRGRWFAKRNLIHGFVAVVLAISAAFFLDFFETKNLLMAGYVILFSLAFISRFISWRIFKKQYEPKIKLEKGYYFSFSEFLFMAPKTNFGKFAIFRAFLGFACAVTEPLLAIYLLRYLDFQYKQYMIVIYAGTIFSLLVMSLWGKFADRYGNYRTMKLTAFFIPLIPVLWIFSSSPMYMIFVPSVISGIAWAGFNLAASNFIYDNVRQEKRGIVVAYYNVLVGIGVFLGAGLGAILIKYLEITFIEPVFFIFILGTVLRILVMVFGISHLKEKRKIKKFNQKHYLRNLILKDAKPALIEEVHQIMAIKKYIWEN